MARTPKYKRGDRVVITDPHDIDCGKTVTVLGLSPSTRKRRSHGQWRYHLSNRAYTSEEYLRLA